MSGAPLFVDVAGMAPGDLRAIDSGEAKILVCNADGEEVRQVGRFEERDKEVLQQVGHLHPAPSRAGWICLRPCGA